MSSLGPRVGMTISVRAGDGGEGTVRRAVTGHQVRGVPGLAVTHLPGDDCTWRITHLASGHRVSTRDWPTPELAGEACTACCRGCDWSRDAAQVVQDPGAHASAARLLRWQG